ncbi:MAG TPA: hypothetical protein VHD90_06530 [Phototrophicaceae bacterium]|nr:hypothetical protein [Phototrophicaceae bacterium]
MSGTFLVLSTFLAAGVEGIEALTIVLATGITRGWRSALLGMAVALVALIAIIVILGPAIALIPLDALRIVIGTLLLIFGLQWLRKAILRASGLKSQRDEDAIYQREVAEMKAQPAPRTDWTGFVVAFKGVFLEGLEVAFIVVTFGSSAHDLPLAALGAGLAVLAVIVAGLVLRRPLSSISENTLKFSVGLLLTAFGTFWSGEGIGVQWPGEDLMLIILLIAYGLLSWGLVTALRRREAQSAAPAGGQS